MIEKYSKSEKTMKGPNAEQRLKDGVQRKLQRSEIRRGYFYITNAAYKNDFLDANYLSVVFDNKLFEKLKVDNFGRVILGRKFLAQYGTDTLIKVQQKNRKTVEVSILNKEKV